MNAAENEALAHKLLGSDQRALVVVWCPPRPINLRRPGRKPRPRRHRLAAIYEMPEGAPVLCVRGFSIMPRDLFEDRPDGAPVVFPAFAYPLTGDRDILARCEHGTYTLGRTRLRDVVARAQLRGKTQDTWGSWSGYPGWPD